MSAHSPLKPVLGTVTRRAGLAAAALVVTMLALPLGGLAPSTAHASASSDEARFLALTNQLRASVGAPPLALDAGMSNVARGWAQQMAASGGISHNPSRGSQITGWSLLAENVGVGSAVDIIHQALVNSPSHYVNLVNGEFSLVGIGVAYGPSMIYVAQNFVAPAGGGGAPQVEYEPEPEPEVVESPPPVARSVPPTTSAPEPPPTSVAAPGPAPAPAPVPEPVPAQLRSVVDQLQQWTAVFFPGPDSSVALEP